MAEGAKAVIVPPGWSPRVKAGVHSEIGNVRTHNEDSYFVPGYPPVTRYNSANSSGNFDPTVEMSVMAGPDNLFVVADGMGGQLAGEQASQMAVEIIPRRLGERLVGPEELDRKQVKDLIRESVSKANEEILALAAIGSAYSNMGTTCTILLLYKSRAYVAGIGDSRVYVLRKGQHIEQLTEDHSLAKALERAGTIKPEEVATHKYSNVLYLYLGSRDAKDGPEVIRELDIAPGDRYLMASDGLTGVVTDAVLEDYLLKSVDPLTTAKELVALALKNNSKDNVTCAVIHIE